MPSKINFYRFGSSFFLIFFILFTILCLYLAYLFSPVNQKEAEESRFAIPKGQSISQIGDRLQEQKLIKSSLFFKIFIKISAAENKIQAGSFLLSPQMNLGQIIEELGKGSEDSWVTIPEGWRREEIAESLSRQEFTAFDQLEFLSLSKDYEGQLFPDTYLLPKEITAEAFFNLLTNTFTQKTKDLSWEEADLILASIIEREGKGYEEMRQIAGVLNNRLKIGMPLQADATLQYLKGFNKNEKSWWSPPLATDKELKSPYNSYLNPGLPPSPICNPGLDALKAALNPATHSYLYYLHDSSGKIYYARDYETHLSNINKYLQ